MTDPDPRTDANDDEVEAAINEGRSASTPAEGGDDTPGEQPGSPQG